MITKSFKRILTFALTLILMFALAVPAFAWTTEDIEDAIGEFDEKNDVEHPEFTDVPAEHWAHDSIQYLTTIKVISGIGNNCFAPNQCVNYTEFFAFVGRTFDSNYFLMPSLFGYDLTGKPWWWLGMEIALKRDLLRGTAVENAYAGGEWNIGMLEQPVTRYDMAQILYNLYLDSLTLAWNQRVSNPMIADIAKIPAKYIDAVKWAYQYGLLSGIDPSGTFRGDYCMTRAEASIVIARLDLGQWGKHSLYPSEDYYLYPDACYSINHSTTAPKTGYLTSGKPITEENIAEIIEQLKVEYPNGMKWGDPMPWEADAYRSRSGGVAAYLLDKGSDGIMYWKKPISELDPYILSGDPYDFNASWEYGGCESFALMFQDAIFGAKTLINPLTVHQDMSKVKIGDIIITGNPDIHGCHWQVVYGFTKDVNGNSIPLVVSGNSGGFVSYSWSSKSTIVSDWNPTETEDFIITRWPVS